MLEKLKSLIKTFTEFMRDNTIEIVIKHKATEQLERKIIIKNVFFLFLLLTICGLIFWKLI